MWRMERRGPRGLSHTATIDRILPMIDLREDATLDRNMLLPDMRVASTTAPPSTSLATESERVAALDRPNRRI